MPPYLNVCTKHNLSWPAINRAKSSNVAHVSEGFDGQCFQRNCKNGRRGSVRKESDPGWGSADWISNGIRCQDPGGGKKQLTSFRDETVVWPVLPTTLQSVGLQSGEVRVSTVLVNVTRK